MQILMCERHGIHIVSTLRGPGEQCVLKFEAKNHHSQIWDDKGRRCTSKIAVLTKLSSIAHGYAAAYIAQTHTNPTKLTCL